VTVAVPAQVDSASVIGGLSFADFRSALKTFETVGDGDGVGEAVGVGLETAAGELQAAIAMAAAAMPANTRIFDPPCGSIRLYGRFDHSDEDFPVSDARPSRPISTDSVEDGHPSRAEVTLRL
jgi:hypothetical protein